MNTSFRWYKQLPLLNAIQFSTANGIPILEALPDYPIPMRTKSRLLEALRSGVSFGEALRNAGVPEKEAMLLDVKGGAQGASMLLELNLESVSMASKWKGVMAESFAYPSVVVLLSIVCSWFLQSIGAITPSLWSALYLFLVSSFFALQASIVIFRIGIPVLARIQLLEDARILFLYLRYCFAQRMDEVTSVKMAMGELGLVRATGPEALLKVQSGEPFLSVLAGMPAVAALGMGIPAMERVDHLLDTLARAADQEWNGNVDKLHVLLKTTTLLLSGATVLVLTIRVFLSVYATGVE